MPYYCTVPRCTSMAGKAKNVSFHQFPRDEGLAKLWNEVLKRGKPYTKYSKVCSLHFKPEDYTIATGQKNKGQWRTLRKDAVPSQNLPSESPAEDRQRRSSWPSTLNLDSSMHHQMAQAIYVQTMLAMQAAGISDSGVNLMNTDQPSPSMNETSPDEDSDTNTHTEHEQTHTSIAIPETVTYKCQKCSKCFKDPDVLLLHQRIHTKSEPGNTEMLKANPILANLLKNDTENVNKNVASIENQIMSALTENMANYLRNLSTIMTNGNPFGVDNVSGNIDNRLENGGGSNSAVIGLNEAVFKDNIDSVDLSIDKDNLDTLSERRNDRTIDNEHGDIDNGRENCDNN